MTDPDLELTLENYLHAVLVRHNLRGAGPRTLADRRELGLISGPEDLEWQIAPAPPAGNPQIRASQCWALACVYRSLLDQLIELFGGPQRVLQHLRHLQECREQGQLTEAPPVEDIVKEATIREALADICGDGE